MPRIRFVLLGLALCGLCHAQQKPQGPYQQALAHHANGRYRQAVTSYGRAIMINPRNVRAYNNRGICRVELGDFRGAIADFSRALALDPAGGQTIGNRGLAFLKMKAGRRALADFDRAITLTRASAPLHLARGVARQQLGDLQGALRDYKLAQMGDEQYAEAYYNLGVINQLQGRMKGAEADFRAAVKHATPKQAPRPRPKPDEPDPRIGKLIAQLGDPVWKRRTAAHRALVKIGKPAIPGLTAALKSKDPEVRSRARQIIDAIHDASSPPAIQVRNTPATLRLARQALAALAGGSAKAPAPIVPPPVPFDRELMRKFAARR